MKAVTLCAGMGRRLRPLTEDTPKCLLDISGKSLLERQCDVLAPHVDEIIVVTGYRGDQVVERMRRRCTFVHNDRYATTNSIYSLWLAQKALVGHGFVFVNGDIVFDEALLKALMDCPSPEAALVDDRGPLHDGEMNVRIEDGRIVEFSKSIPAVRADALSLQIVKFGADAGALVLQRVDELVAEGRTTLFPAAAYDEMLAVSKLTPVYCADGRCVEIDTPEDLEAARRMFGA